MNYSRTETLERDQPSKLQIDFPVRMRFSESLVFAVAFQKKQGNCLITPETFLINFSFEKDEREHSIENRTLSISIKAPILRVLTAIPLIQPFLDLGGIPKSSL